jgi:PAS domain S-box-containing protein
MRVEAPPAANAAFLRVRRHAARLTHRAGPLVLVAIAYYLGAKLGFSFTLHPSPVSTLWPPNAIVLAALLLTPPARWGAIALAVLPAHAAIQMDAGVPTGMMLSWYSSNLAEALLGAALLRPAGGSRPAFETFRYTLAFMCGSFAATFLTSFLDAWFVMLNDWGDMPFWIVWRTRLCSNMLATLTLVPAIVLVAQNLDRIRHASARQWLEAGLHAAVLLAVSWWIFVMPESGSGRSLALTFAVTPVLIVAALRFGPLGISLSLLACGLLAVAGVAWGRGPFAGGAPLDTALSLQLFLIVTQISLLLLAAVTEDRTRAEAHRRTSDKQFQLALQTTGVAPFDWDISTDTTPSSTAAWHMLGSEPPSGRASQRFLELVHADDRPQVAGMLDDAIHGRRRDLDIEYRVPQAGGIGWFHVRGTTISDERGDVRRMVGVNVNITERKRAEMEIQEQRRELTHLGRVALVGELSVLLTHELKQPLTAILFNAKTGQRLLSQQPPDLAQVRAILEDIAFDDGRATEVITRLRALLRNDHDRHERLDVNHLVRESLKIARPDLVLHNVALDTRLAGSSLHVQADRIQLQQTLLNLMINGCEAMETVPAGARRLRVSTHASGGWVGIDVSDSGGGISCDPPDRVFEPFVTTKDQGLGLGLSICRSIVSSHGGRIWAENGPDGATFHLFLPAAAESA